MKRALLILIGVLISLAVLDVVVLAGTSSNYRIDESFIGPGGTLESNSANYSTAPGGQSLGNIGVRESESANYRTQAGTTTTNDPSLTCSVGSSSLNFGSLSTSATATATATFSVLNYTSYGYIVQIVGATPATGSHNLTAMNPGAASSVGTEQFGINLVDNSSPNVGTDPVQTPDSSFSFGGAATNYETPNTFRYVNGETIAQATKTSGLTDYTVSYIINVANTTPGGSYSGSQTLVCIGTY